MKEQLENLRVKLAERLDDAEQEAKYARSGDAHAYHRTRAEELEWCLHEIITILGDGDVS